MKSSVSNYIDYQNIPVPEDLLTIEIPSWEEVAQPMVDFVEEKYAEAFQTEWAALTDEMVASMQIPGIETVSDVKKYGMDTYQKNQEYFQYFEKVLPFILNYYYTTTNTVFDREEKNAYVEDYLNQVEYYAQEAEMPLKKYVQDKLHLTGDPKEAIQQRALEDLTFKLIALDVFEKRGMQLNEATYENFIQQTVLYQQMDEIELRAEMPLEKYLASMPEMQLSQEMFNYFLDQMKVKINPEAPVRLFNGQ